MERNCFEHKSLRDSNIWSILPDELQKIYENILLAKVDSPLRKVGSALFQHPLRLRSSLKCFLKQIHMENGQKSCSRGALIVLEGLDRSGKTSQSSRLIAYLEGLGHPVESWRFPDRDTSVGKMISSYLANESNLDDHAIHLLFSQIVGKRGLLLN